MLKNINPLLSPELLKILREMGHGDQIAIVDASYPAASGANKLIRLDGCSATEVLDGIVSVMPIDTFVEHAVHSMQVVGDPESVPEIVEEFVAIINKHNEPATLNSIERHQFYRAVQQAYAVVATGEGRLYGNVLLTKGIISPC